jgi:CP family cyanate transporter-like MFS transporter
VGIAGNFAAPLVAQRTGNAQAVVVGCSALILVGLAGVLFAPTVLPLAWATLLGIGTGGTFSLTLLLMASRAQDEVIARRLSSMAQGIGYMVSALGPLVAGLLHSLSGGWTLPVLAMIAICATQLGAGLAAARPGAVVR